MVCGAPAVALPGSKNLVPLVSLGYLLGLDQDRVTAAAGGMMAVMLMRSGGVVAGIIVDELVSVEDAVIHGTEETLHGQERDRKGVVSGKRVFLRVDHGCRRIIKKKTKDVAKIN